MFSHLNAAQRKAVETTEGRLLILAGAGSGKTSTLTCRIAHLLCNKRVPAKAILGLTFTNKAALEMKERMQKWVSRDEAKKLTLCTFHSFCMQVLRGEIHRLGYTKDFSLYDERDVRRLITQLAKEELGQDSLEPTIAKIAWLKSQGETQEPHELLDKLNRCMRAYNAVDFDSLLSLTEQLFQQFPEVLKSYQQRFAYILVDEFQDTSPVQYRLVEMLSATHGNLCVVGDDDQSIYSWRGASVHTLLDMKVDHLFKLEQNYRSSPKILHAANQLIAKNKRRHGKELWSQKIHPGEVTLFCAPSEVEEASAVAERLVHLHEKNIPWKEMAILYRSNILSRTFETALLQRIWKRGGSWVRGIPYRIFGGTELTEKSEIKDIAAYLRVIANPLDQGALLRILNVPRRGISEKTIDRLTHYNRGQNVALWFVLQEISRGSLVLPEITAKAHAAIKQFVELIEKAEQHFSRHGLAESYGWLLELINYESVIVDEVKTEKVQLYKWENVLQIQEMLASYEKEEKGAKLTHFLSEVLLHEDKYRGEKEEKGDFVSLMTFHSAKGLEFTGCFLVALEDHLLPHEKCLKEDNLEEERRLLYVGMTRAKEHLTLSMAKQRKVMGHVRPTQPSRFVFEIPKDLYTVSSWKNLNRANDNTPSSLEGTSLREDSAL